jgi:cold shock CspA family protein
MDDLAIRRPELLNILRLGTVRWYKEEKGIGRITADDGEVLFVVFANVVREGSGYLEQGERVCFVWRGEEVAEGRHSAEDVRVIGQPQPLPYNEVDDSEADSGKW